MERRGGGVRATVREPREPICEVEAQYGRQRRGDSEGEGLRLQREGISGRRGIAGHLEGEREVFGQQEPDPDLPQGDGILRLRFKDPAKGGHGLQARPEERQPGTVQPDYERCHHQISQLVLIINSEIMKRIKITLLILTLSFGYGHAQESLEVQKG